MAKMVGLSKVIFKFTSREKRNVCYKLLTKGFNVDSGVIEEKDTLITEETALLLQSTQGIEIKDLDAKADEDFEDYLDLTEEEITVKEQMKKDKK